jgi:2-polyprenyl-6-methoxyphenol hydroxylase-like FAD-dependent oxidoreductase
MYQNTPHAALAKPEYSGFAAIICRNIENLPQELLAQLEEKYLNGGRIVTIVSDNISDNSGKKDPRMMLFRQGTGQFGYIIHAALPGESLQDKLGSDLIELAIKTLAKANFPEMLQQLVRVSPPGNMQQRPYYIHRASNQLQLPSTAIPHLTTNEQVESPWSAGRIVLVGDAAHGMPPFMAQGTNQGFADALVVASLIANLQLDDSQEIPTVWEKYEQLRRLPMMYAQQATLNHLIQPSQTELQEYNQRVYCQDFVKLIEGLRLPHSPI